MPIPATLEQGLQAMVDNPPASEAESIVQHAAAFRAYMETMTVPPVSPAGHAAGETAFQGAAAGQSLPPPVGILAIQTAMVAYCAACVADPGAAPFAPVPPASPPPVAGADLATYCAAIDTWVKTGTAIPPPGPAVVPWS